MNKLKKLLSISTATALIATAPVSVEAKPGWNNTNSGTYYEYSNGTRANGLVRIDGKYYFFENKKQYTGWTFDKNGNPCRYFNPFDGGGGAAATGWVTESPGKIRYFDAKTAICKKGWVTTGGRKRYFYPTTALMAIGWVRTNGNYRYFNKKTGVMITGWVKSGEKMRFFDTATGVMYKNKTVCFGGKSYKFDKNGYAKAVK